MITSTKNKAWRLLAVFALSIELFRSIVLPAFVYLKSDRIETVMDSYSTWFKTCTHVLLDLGANRGDTILRWFTDERFTGRAKSSSVDGIYSLRQRQKFCVL